MKVKVKVKVKVEVEVPLEGVRSCIGSDIESESEITSGRETLMLRYWHVTPVTELQFHLQGIR